MSQPIELNIQLARRIELAEAEAAVACAERVSGTHGVAGAAVESIAGGYAIYCGADSPVTQAVAIGLQGPVSRDEFDQLETFYFQRREPIRVETCPLVDASLTEHYKERGYHVSEFSNVMVRPVEIPQPPFKASSVEIQKASDGELDAWTLTVAQGFAEQFPVTQELLSLMKMFAGAPNTECYLARMDGRIAGGATLAVRKGIAGFFGASTLPQFRNRGVQTALLQFRMQRAVQLGCDLAVSLAQPGSISQRNITRSGFQTLYTRVKFERPFLQT
jgi:GNAT superfamily N-acetyltransferase